ncbi:MAG: hypothetical protein ABI856_11585 [Nitrospira sp.]
MKAQRLWVMVGAIFAMGIAGCAGTSHLNREPIAPDDPVIGLLSKGITQLTVNINTLSKRMNDVQQMSSGTDPGLQELRALDLSGWQLHQQQWVLQRDHLLLARDTLQQVHKNPGENGRLLDQWRQHWQQYVKSLEELRLQRQSLERKHLEVETRLIEQRLQ